LIIGERVIFFPLLNKRVHSSFVISGLALRFGKLKWPRKWIKEAAISPANFCEAAKLCLIKLGQNTKVKIITVNCLRLKTT
jgi:hypothetical protein